ncbi:MAG: diaminopimelate decarboxylase [Actinomycetota bacterium]|nr:diaminopimelate decarboxylase [Actinomycetota bacterium]
MSQPWPRTAGWGDGWLTSVGGVDVDELAAEYGTPLYVLDRSELLARMREYRRAFGPDVSVVYAAKALCVVGVLQLVAGEGLGVDVASDGELLTAERAGFPMQRVVFHGNNKSRNELRRAAQLGVGTIVADSLNELERIAAVAAEERRQLAVMLRITPGVAASTHTFIATGHDDAKFGFSLWRGAATQGIERALALPRVRLAGLHCHIGSQVTATDDFVMAAKAMCRLLGEVRDRHGVELDELNLGGGLGIAYSADDRIPAITAYADRLLTTVRDELAARCLATPRLAFEPGRSIVGPAGLTLYRVGTGKQVAGLRRWVSVDGGMSDNLRPALYGARYQVAPAGRPRPGGTAEFSVAGKHCETGDVVATDVDLPDDLGDGDLLAVAATGAYGYAMSSNYNRLPRPAMVLAGDGTARLLVRRETLDDVLSHDVALG